MGTGVVGCEKLDLGVNAEMLELDELIFLIFLVSFIKIGVRAGYLACVRVRVGSSRFKLHFSDIHSYIQDMGLSLSLSLPPLSLCPLSWCPSRCGALHREPLSPYRQRRSEVARRSSSDPCCQGAKWLLRRPSCEYMREVEAQRRRRSRSGVGWTNETKKPRNEGWTNEAKKPRNGGCT